MKAKCIVNKPAFYISIPVESHFTEEDTFNTSASFFRQCISLFTGAGISKTWI